MENNFVVFAVIGLALILMYFIRYRKRKDYQLNAIKTTGVVVDVVVEFKGVGRFYYPIVSFTLNDGTWVREKYSDGSTPSLFKKGEQVELLYKSDDPASFMIVNDKSNYFDKILLAIGVIIILYSLFVFIR
ncbi:DUF3592 domain-containing protein [Pedobacter nutrimenti]|uniref:Uncharacterized protein DUF3592 n=1 Tax=Pedobacter nutrimenti TaxID=1241337 RepID=A0A318UDA4_9SPHI|nr:DUF3592 domain-containing protein [Pedobacter nutrimenti]PYF74063.1 uncharacterized protein DUF3592 [Pedobacter nutrimenti]